ncbi:MAG: hypothetical protein ACYCWE_22370, partial [Eubacteriales bacterium]
YKASEMSDKVILSVTNNGDYVLNSVYADILFFKRNKIVGYNSEYFTDSKFELKVGRTINKELYCYETYDSYLVFLNAGYYNPLIIEEPTTEAPVTEYPFP